MLWSGLHMNTTIHERDGGGTGSVHVFLIKILKTDHYFLSAI